MVNKFNYFSKEQIQSGGKKTVRKVTIKNGKGYKSVTKYVGKKSKTFKKKINNTHLGLIKMGKFIPGLFNDCNKNK